MGIFDIGFGAPDDSGWQTRVTPGGADPNNLSLAERIRSTLTGTTDPLSPQAANVGSTAGKMLGAALAKPAAPPQPQAAAVDPKVPTKPGIDPQHPLMQSGPGHASPFAAAAAGSPRPQAPRIYQTGQQSPFASMPA